MQKPIFIGGISAVLLLSVLVGVFVGPAFPRDAQRDRSKQAEK